MLGFRVFLWMFTVTPCSARIAGSLGRRRRTNVPRYLDYFNGRRSADRPCANVGSVLRELSPFV